MADGASTPVFTDSDIRGLESRNQFSGWIGRSRRFTPYTKTPKSRKLVKPSKNGAKEQSVPLKRLVQKTWYVYQVTPMYQFQRDANSLKRYSRHLSSHLQSEAQKGHGFGTSESLGARALFQKVPGLEDAEGNSEGIEITVSSRENRNGNGTRRVTLTAILSSFGVKDLTEFDVLAKDLKRFPLLLIKGLVTPIRQTIAWLESQFDCKIRRMTFNPVILSWMVAMWTGFEDGPLSKPVELKYAIPPTVTGLSHITMTIQQEDAAKLWKCIHKGGMQGEVLSEEVADYLEALESHFFHHFKVHLSAMTLKRIGTPLACVGSEGRLKILMTSGVRTVLYHLAENALESSGHIA